MTVYPLRSDDGQLRVDRPDINEVLGTATPYTIRWEDANLTGLSSISIDAGNASTGRAASSAWLETSCAPNSARA